MINKVNLGILYKKYEALNFGYIKSHKNDM